MSAALPTPPICPLCGATTQIPGPQGPVGPTGPTGATGSAGPQGPAGTGSAIYGAAGIPAGGLGVIGDWYFNTANGDVYQKTGSSTWTLKFNTTGPSGSSSAIQVSAGVPNNGTGSDGDWDLDTNKGDWYHKETGAWVLKYTNSIALGSQVTGTLGHAHGGTDATTLQAAINGMIPGANGDVVIRTGGNVTTLANPTDATKVLVGTNPPSWAATPVAFINGKFMRHLIAPFAYPAASMTTILWDTLDIDNESAYNVGTGVYTCPQSGLYLINIEVTSSHADNNVKAYGVTVNGGDLTTVQTMSYFAMVFLLAAHQINVNIEGGSNGGVSAGSYLSIVRVG